VLKTRSELVTPKFVAFPPCYLATPLLAEQEETFTEITPGLEARIRMLIPPAEKAMCAQ
jgi:hypothetical protein